MIIKYKIIELNASEHAIVVRYYTERITEAMLAVDVLDGVIRRCRTDYAIDLPVPAPTGAELDRFISARAPVAWFATLEAVQNPNIDTSMAAFTQMLGVEQQVVAVVSPAAVTPAMNIELEVVTT